MRRTDCTSPRDENVGGKLWGRVGWEEYSREAIYVCERERERERELDSNFPHLNLEFPYLVFFGARRRKLRTSDQASPFFFPFGLESVADYSSTATEEIRMGKGKVEAGRHTRTQARPFFCTDTSLSLKQQPARQTDRQTDRQTERGRCSGFNRYSSPLETHR